MTSRDDLLIGAGVIAARLENTNEIIFGDGIFEFVVNSIADYIMTNSNEPFGPYIEDVLKEEYGTISSAEAKSCSTCRYDNDIYAKICNTCDWREKWKPKESDNE